MVGGGKAHETHYIQHEGAPPVQLGWDPYHHEVMTHDEYRGLRTVNRPRGHVRHIGAEERDRLLRVPPVPVRPRYPLQLSNCLPVKPALKDSGVGVVPPSMAQRPKQGRFRRSAVIRCLDISLIVLSFLLVSIMGFTYSHFGFWIMRNGGSAIGVNEAAVDGFGGADWRIEGTDTKAVVGEEDKDRVVGVREWRTEEEWVGKVRDWRFRRIHNRAKESDINSVETVVGVKEWRTEEEWAAKVREWRLHRIHKRAKESDLDSVELVESLAAIADGRMESPRHSEGLSVDDFFEGTERTESLRHSERLSVDDFFEETERTDSLRHNERLSMNDYFEQTEQIESLCHDEGLSMDTVFEGTERKECPPRSEGLSLDDSMMEMVASSRHDPKGHFQLDESPYTFEDWLYFAYLAWTVVVMIVFYMENAWVESRDGDEEDDDGLVLEDRDDGGGDGDGGGDRDGNGEANGDGEKNADGNGEGNGDGNADGNADGNGEGNGDGDGEANGDGEENGEGNGDGNGDGDGGDGVSGSDGTVSGTRSVRVVRCAVRRSARLAARYPRKSARIAMLPPVSYARMC